jgi:hypothetical protein
MKRPLLAALALSVLLAGGIASAHKPSDSYLSLAVEGPAIHGRWDIALRDLDFALGLDADQDDAITWGEVRAKEREIARYALARLALGAGGARCPAEPRELLIDNHSDGAYAVLRFDAACASAPRMLAVDYRLLFDLDPQHHGLVRVTAGGVTRTGVLTESSPARSFVLAQPSLGAELLAYGEDGVRHIFTGFDHVLFLLSLLLPAVLVASAHSWQPATRLRTVFADVVKVVSAFTLAHSLTLSLAALGAVSPPARWVESGIALSVVLAALNNLRPLVHGRRWAIAFGFGLIHGFGFAAVLADLGLPRESLLAALVAFNAGVEAGQLAIVAVFLPLAYALRATVLYRRVVVAAGSGAIVLLAGAWLVERAFDVQLVG